MWRWLFSIWGIAFEILNYPPSNSITLSTILYGPNYLMGHVFQESFPCNFYLGCVCFYGKLKSENILHPGPCLATPKNKVKLKIEFSFTFKYFPEFTHSSHTHTNLILAPAHAPNSTQPTVRRQAPATQPSQGHQPQLNPQSDAKLRPPSQAKASPDRITPTAAQIALPYHPYRIAQPSQGQPRSHRPTTFLFFLSSSSTLLLPLAQHRWSGCHRPPAPSTPFPNPSDLAAAVLHPRRSFSFSIYLSFPQSLPLSCSFSHWYIMYMFWICFYFDFWFC